MKAEKINKILVGLERVAEAHKALLWEKAKLHGISPIQIQILRFLENHNEELRNVSHLAKEFNVTKPTISDAVRVLDNKGLLEKDYSSVDNRSYTLSVSQTAKSLLKDLDEYALPIEKALEGIGDHDLDIMFDSLAKVIYQLNQSGILTVQRTCFGCHYYESNSGAHFCKLLKTKLENSEIQLDCKDFLAR